MPPSLGSSGQALWSFWKPIAAFGTSRTFYAVLADSISCHGVRFRPFADLRACWNPICRFPTLDATPLLSQPARNRVWAVVGVRVVAQLASRVVPCHYTVKPSIDLTQFNSVDGFRNWKRSWLSMVHGIPTRTQRFRGHGIYWYKAMEAIENR